MGNSLTLIDVDLQLIKLVDVFGCIPVSHRDFDVGVRQLHRSDVAVAGFGGGIASTDLLESSSRTRHVGRANSVPKLRTHALIGHVNIGFKLLDECLVDCVRHFAVLNESYSRTGVRYFTSARVSLAGLSVHHGP